MEEQENYITKTTSIKRERGIDSAIEYLINLSIANDRNINQADILGKLKIYAAKSKKYDKAEIISFFSNTINTITDNEIRLEAWSHFGDLYTRYKMYKEVIPCVRSAISLNNPYNAIYILRMNQLFRQMAEANWQLESYADFLFYSLSAEIIFLGWDLYTAASQNMKLFSLPYQHNFWSFNNAIGSIKVMKESDYPFADEEIQTAQAAIQIFKGIDLKYYDEKYKEIYCNLYPSALGFKKEFLKPGYSDLKEFVLSFTDDEQLNFDQVFPSKAVVLATDMTNELLSNMAS